MENKAEKTISDNIFVGIDDGRAYTKIYAGNGVQFKIKTSVKSGSHVSSAGLSGEPETTGIYESEGLSYTVGNMVDGEDTRFEHFDGSVINRVAVHHALIGAGLSGKNVSIITGLPVSSFYDGSAVNLAFIEKKREGLKISVNSLNSSKPAARIVKNRVISEALSAWIDDVLDDSGKLKAGSNMEYPCGVVDFGGRTLDTILINPPSSIDHERSGSAQIGVLNLLDLIDAALKRKFNLSSIQKYAVESAATKKVFRTFGQDRDVSEIVEEAMSKIQAQVDREIQRKFGNAADLDRIIFVGGGSALMPQILNNYPNAVMVNEPEFANARGMYKYLLHGN